MMQFYHAFHQVLSFLAGLSGAGCSQITLYHRALSDQARTPLKSTNPVVESQATYRQWDGGTFPWEARLFIEKIEKFHFSMTRND